MSEELSNFPNFSTKRLKKIINSSYFVSNIGVRFWSVYTFSRGSKNVCSWLLSFLLIWRVVIIDNIKGFFAAVGLSIFACCETVLCIQLFKLQTNVIWDTYCAWQFAQTRKLLIQILFMYRNIQISPAEVADWLAWHKSNLFS